MTEVTIDNVKRTTTPKVGKPELWFLWSAHHLIKFYINVKFHENISYVFKLRSGHYYGMNVRRQTYSILPNYCTMHLGLSKYLETLVVNIHLISNIKKGKKMTSNEMYAIFFSEFLYKSICCWYLFELPVKPSQMSTNNICFYKEANKSTQAVI